MEGSGQAEGGEDSNKNSRFILKARTETGKVAFVSEGLAYVKTLEKNIQIKSEAYFKIPEEPFGSPLETLKLCTTIFQHL